MTEEKKSFKLLIPILALVLVVGLWAYTTIYCKTMTQVERGTFGDMFGAVNALFSGLAFAGIIYTILLQRDELTLQRLELQETRNELKRSADAQERSERALINQQNQTTFFNLLEQQKKLIETLKLMDGIGFEGLRTFATYVRKGLNTYTDMESKKHFPDFSDTSKHASVAIYTYRAQINTYLKNMETIVNFIEKYLSNDQLFHSILYNYISVPEKYLLGICYYYGKDIEVDFLKRNYNYLELFETSLEKNRNDLSKYFPYISYKRFFYKNIYEEMFKQDYILLSITVYPIFDLNDIGISIESIEITFTAENEEIVIQEVIDDKIIITKENKKTKVDFTNYIKEKLPTLNDGNYVVSYNFSIRYEDRVYLTAHKHNLNKSYYYHMKEDEDEPTESYHYIISDPEKEDFK